MPYVMRELSEEGKRLKPTFGARIAEPMNRKPMGRMMDALRTKVFSKNQRSVFLYQAVAE